jgi:hypothetical protein
MHLIAAVIATQGEQTKMATQEAETTNTGTAAATAAEGANAASEKGSSGPEKRIC